MSPTPMSTEKPEKPLSLAALLARAIEDDFEPSQEESERWVSDDEDGYSA